MSRNKFNGLIYFAIINITQISLYSSCFYQIVVLQCSKDWRVVFLSQSQQEMEMLLCFFVQLGGVEGLSEIFFHVHTKKIGDPDCLYSNTVDVQWELSTASPSELKNHLNVLIKQQMLLLHQSTICSAFYLYYDSQLLLIKTKPVTS